MAFERTRALDAWKRTAGKDHANWTATLARTRDVRAMLALAPKFKLAASSRFFCMGSCFARNIEEHLIYREAPVLSKRIICFEDPWANRPNGYVNKFTTHSMMQEMLWQFAPPGNVDDLLLETDKGWFDLNLTPGLKPAPHALAARRRAYLLEDYFPRMRDADVMILTLGLNEVWYDKASGVWLNASPPFHILKAEADRYELHVTDADENVRQLEGLRDALKQFNPDARLIVTVSPVPMSTTFSGADILVANSLSKATLRVAAQTFCSRHSDADYFPSYEFVTSLSRDAAYREDGMHVRNEVVGHIMDAFLGAYMNLPASTEPGFVEGAYLKANPDVRAATLRGELESGYSHWKTQGRSEGRPLAPPDAKPS